MTTPSRFGDDEDERLRRTIAARKASITSIPRLPTIGGQPVWPLRFAVAVGLAIAVGILVAWWCGPILFLGTYFGLAAIDLKIQRWKLAHYQETGRWPSERESDIPEDERLRRDVDRIGREVGMEPKEAAKSIQHFARLVEHSRAAQGHEEADDDN